MTYRVDDLRDSVRDYRDPNTTYIERAYIISFWALLGIPQFAAMIRAAKIEKEEGN